MSYEDKLVGLLNPRTGHTVLDIGCGKGKFIPLIRKAIGKTGQIHGLDINELAIAAARAKYGNPSIQFKVLNFDDLPLPFPDETFDKIICHNVIECIENKTTVINESYRCLKEGGIFLLSHHDFDTAVYNSRHKQLTRELVHLFADTKQGWQKASDGQMGRKLKELISGSHFQKFGSHTLLIEEQDFSPESYGYQYCCWTIDMALKSNAYSAHELELWKNDFSKMSDLKSYYFSILVMAVVAEK